MIHPQIFENFEIKKPLRRPCGEDGTHTPHKKPIQKTKCSRGAHTHTQRMAMGKGRGFNQHSNTLILHIQAAWRGLIVSLDLLPCKMCFLSATSGPMWGKVWLVGISYLVSSWHTIHLTNVYMKEVRGLQNQSRSTWPNSTASCNRSLFTLPETNSSPLKIGRNPIGK